MKMEEVRVFEIQIVTRKLGKHRYTISEVAVVQESDLPEQYHEGSRVLMDNVRKMEFSEQESASDMVQDIEEKDSQPAKKKKFRKLKKPNLALFEEVVDEMAILDEELDKKINLDHYYDIIQPYDAQNQVIMQKKKSNKKILIGLMSLMGVLIAVLIWLIGDILS